MFVSIAIIYYLVSRITYSYPIIVCNKDFIKYKVVLYINRTSPFKGALLY